MHALTHRHLHVSGLSTRPHCRVFLRNWWTSAATMRDDDQLGCFPKSSGPPGPPSDNWQTYVRRRVTAEVNAMLDERSRREEQFSRDLSFSPCPSFGEFACVGIAARFGRHGQATAATYYVDRIWKRGQARAPPSSRSVAASSSFADFVCRLLFQDHS